MIFVYFCDIFGQVWAPPLQTRLAVTPVVIGTLRHPSRPSISWLECHWRLVELFPDPADQLPRHPDCLTILKERKDPTVILPLLVAGASLSPLLRHLYLAALLLKVVPELINSWVVAIIKPFYLYIHMDLP